MGCPGVRKRSTGCPGARPLTAKVPKVSYLPFSTLVEEDECFELLHLDRGAQAGDPIAGEHWLVVDLVAPQELRADVPDVQRKRRPRPGVIGRSQIDTMLRHQGEGVSRPHRLAAGRQRRRQLRPVLKRRARERVVDVSLEQTPETAPESDFDSLAPRAADVLEEHPGGAGRRHREDVVMHVGPVARDVRVQPRKRP